MDARATSEHARTVASRPQRERAASDSRRLLAARAPAQVADPSMAARFIRECAAMAFLYRLLPPRRTFAQDMSSAEADVMQRHVAYWQDLLNRDVALAFGPVLDPKDPWGLGLLDLDDEQAARESERATRRCRPAPAPTSSCRWNSCGPAQAPELVDARELADHGRAALEEGSFPFIAGEVDRGAVCARRRCRLSSSRATDGWSWSEFAPVRRHAWLGDVVAVPVARRGVRRASAAWRSG